MTLPASLMTLLTKMVNSLHRLTGGQIVVENDQLVKNDRKYDATGAVTVRFENLGQTAVRIDDHIILMPGDNVPGDAFIEGDTAGPGLDHSYSIQFLESPDKSGNIPLAGDANPPFQYPGNYLLIRTLRRKLGPNA